jgi:transcriptional regulator with XRE-family HTH domain
MARSGPEFPVDDTWRARVKRELAKRTWSQSRLATEIGCARQTITNLLTGNVNQSPYVTNIHMLFGWSLPTPLRDDAETEELLEVWNKLDQHSRARLLERGHALADGLVPPPKKR